MDADPKFEEKILSLIAEAVPGRFKKSKLTLDLRLQRDLGIDSIGVASLVFRLEEAFGIELEGLEGKIDLGKLRTVGDAIQISRQLVEQARAAQGA